MSYSVPVVQSSPFTITREQAEQLALALVNGGRLTFQVQANRNWVAKIARQKYGVTIYKSSIRGQQLDPRYTVEGSHMPDRGLANDYRHYFPTLYKCERADARGW